MTTFASSFDAAVASPLLGLLETLILGNISGGTDIVMTSGDVIHGADGTGGGAGADLVLRPGHGDGAGIDGALHAGDAPGATAGNARGENATDLQRSRTLATQVASGTFSSIPGGRSNTASGSDSHAEGYYTASRGFATHTEGSGAAVGAGSSGDGYNSGAHAEGAYTFADERAAHAEGEDTYATGRASHAEGQDTHATADFTHTEGRGTYAVELHAHAEGFNTYASGNSSHAEGYNTLASDGSAHAEGSLTIASGSESHAEGAETIASGAISHAEGRYTRAIGNHSHAGGRDALADVAGQFARAGSDRSLTASGKGGTQFSLYALANRTVNATVTDLVTDNASGQLVLRANMTYGFRLMVEARQTGGGAGTVGDSATWIFYGQIKRDGASSTTLDGLFVVQPLALTDEAVTILAATVASGAEGPAIYSAGAAAWRVTVTADDADESLQIGVTGEGSKNIVWSAVVLTCEAGVGQNI